VLHISNASEADYEITGVGRSDRPMLRYISVRTRSATPLTISAPSCAGSMCGRNGRFPKDLSTTLTIALATSATSASAGAWEAVSLAASTNCGEVRSCDSRVRSVSAGRRRRNEPIWVNS
jgi:hypothetical protein